MSPLFPLLAPRSAALQSTRPAVDDATSTLSAALAGGGVPPPSHPPQEPEKAGDSDRYMEVGGFLAGGQGVQNRG